MTLKSILNNLLYLKPCRAYAQHFVGDKPADAVYRFLCSLQFWRIYRFWPNFVKPKRFSEKIWSRMLHDRSPQLTLLNDKLRVRDFVEAKVGSDYLIPLLWSGEKPDHIPFDLLPSEFVIKATHGCSYNVLVQDKTKIDHETIKLKLAKWLNENYCLDFRIGIEWGYKNIKPSIIIEEFLNENGTPPIDYKFYCFSGRVEFLTLHFDRFVEHKTRSFDRNFKPHELTYHFDQWKGECECPSNFQEMVLLAESLSKGFDFIRVDLYSIGRKVYFSELTPYPGGVSGLTFQKRRHTKLTPYPGGVSTKFLPARQDYILGEKWKSK